MEDQELRTLLEKLHDEIEKTGSLDAQGAELLRHLDADIQALLSRTGVQAGQVRTTTVGQLQEGLSHFEATHPALTALLAELLDTLSRAGI